MIIKKNPKPSPTTQVFLSYSKYALFFSPRITSSGNKPRRNRNRGWILLPNHQVSNTHGNSLVERQEEEKKTTSPFVCNPFNGPENLTKKMNKDHQILFNDFFLLLLLHGWFLLVTTPWRFGPDRHAWQDDSRRTRDDVASFSSFLGVCVCRVCEHYR